MNLGSLHRRLPSLRSRRARVGLAGVAAVAVAAATVPLVLGGSTAPAPASPDESPIVELEESVSGREAVTALGGKGGEDLATVAKAHGTTSEKLAESLRSDSTLNVGRDGRLYYADTFEGMLGDDHAHGDEPVRPGDDEPGAQAAEGAATSGSSTTSDPMQGPHAPLADTFRLHSNPAATRKIFLDFDGHAVAASSYWDKLRGKRVSAWDPSGDGPVFSDAELRGVQDLWALVSEDFSSADVDVTTEDPGVEGLRRASTSDPTYGARALIGDLTHNELTTGVLDPSLPGGSGTIGLAHVGIFGSIGWGPAESPAMVFGRGSWGLARPDTMAWTITHEVGHNLDLWHAWDAENPSPVASQGGSHTDLHARIMDYGGAKPLLSFTEEERQHFANLPQRGDEPGTSPADARTPGAGGTTSGYVTASGDEDWYVLEGCTDLQVVGHVSDLTPQLDLALELRDARGDLVQTEAPHTGTGTARRNSGVDAVLTAQLDGSLHHLVVRGSGSSDGAAGELYSRGEVTGGYDLDVAGCGGEKSAPTEPTSVRAVTGGSTSSAGTTVTWSPPRSSGGSAASYEVAVQGRRTVTLPPGTSSHVAPTGTGTPLDVRVRAVNPAGTSPWVTVRSEAAPLPPLHVSARQDASGLWTVHTVLDPRSPGIHARAYAEYSAGGRYTNAYWSAANFTGTYALPATSPTLFAGDRARFVVLDRANERSAAKTYVVRNDRVAPTDPTQVAATATGDSIRLTWATPEDDGGNFAAYRVKVDDGAWTDLDGYTFEHTLSGLSAGGHTVTVQAVHAAGQSVGVSRTVVVDTAHAVPTAPRDLQVEDGATGTSVTWVAPVSAGASPVTAWEVTVGNRTTLLPANRRNLVLTGFHASSSLRIRVAAVNAQGTGPAVGVDLTGP